ncbi:MAG: hypothetical protein ACRCYS_00385, partial [Beijerinckiaceae bacterium]
MFHYFDTVTDTKGNSKPNWQIECVQYSDMSTVVPIFADESSTPIASVSGLTNRAKSDPRGNFDFFVADGTYGLKFYDHDGVFQYQQRYLPMYGADNAASAEAFASAAEAAAADAYASAIAAAGGAPGNLGVVARSQPRPRRFTAPTGMNNPLGVWVDCDGQTFAFNQRPYDLADWTTTVAPVKHIYVSWASGNDANDGSTTVLAVKSFAQAMTLIVDKT